MFAGVYALPNNTAWTGMPQVMGLTFSRAGNYNSGECGQSALPPLRLNIPDLTVCLWGKNVSLRNSSIKLFSFWGSKYRDTQVKRIDVPIFACNFIDVLFCKQI